MFLLKTISQENFSDNGIFGRSSSHHLLSLRCKPCIFLKNVLIFKVFTIIIEIATMYRGKKFSFYFPHPRPQRKILLKCSMHPSLSLLSALPSITFYNIYSTHTGAAAMLFALESTVMFIWSCFHALHFLKCHIPYWYR